MKWILLFLGLVLFTVTFIKPKTEKEEKDLAPFLKHKWKVRIAGIFLFLIGLALFGGGKEEQSKTVVNNKTSKTQQVAEEKNKTQLKDPYISYFSKKTVDAILEQLTPLAQMGYRAKISTNRGEGEFSRNFSYSAHIEKEGKLLGSINYQSTFFLPGLPPDPPKITIFINCYIDRGLLSGCADPKKDPVGFSILKSLWNVIGFDAKDLTTLTQALVNPRKTIEDSDEKVVFQIKANTGINYVLVIKPNFKAELKDGKFVKTGIVDYFQFELYEKDNYDKFMESLQGNKK